MRKTVRMRVIRWRATSFVGLDLTTDEEEWKEDVLLMKHCS